MSGSVSVRKKKHFQLAHHTVTNTREFLGDHGEGETPVPIPNTEVKPFSADGTAWATVWESRTLPRLKFALAKAGHESLPETAGFFLALWGDVVVAYWRVFIPLESGRLSNGIDFWRVRD